RWGKGPIYGLFSRVARLVHHRKAQHMRANSPSLGHRGYRSNGPIFGQVDIYRDAKPQVAYKQVGFLTNDGRVFEREEIEQSFCQRAQEMGGDGVVILPPVKSLEAPEGWDLYTTFVYEAVV